MCFRNACLVLATLASGVASQSDAERRAIASVERISDRAQHSAFTDLVRWRGGLWCTFREGSGHVPGSNGVVRVLTSDDGHEWRTAALLDLEDVDLRDPKLSVTADDRLMVLMGGSVYRGQERIGAATRVSFTSDGASLSPPESVALDPSIETGQDWLWRVTWLDGRAYGVVYQTAGVGTRTHLVTSPDGRAFEKVATWDLDGRANETTLRFLPDGRMVALVRREAGDRTGRIGVASAPFAEWTWSSLPVRLGGPELVVVPREGGDVVLLAITREYGDPTRTVVARVDLDGAFERLLTLPSAGDTSYAGAVLDGDRLLVSYYSSHEGRTSIYLARLRVSALLAPR